MSVLETCHLTVFTRYPVPGQTKTRLIPALGAEGAAQMQQQLTEHTLGVVQDWITLCEHRQTQLKITVRFTGGDRIQMESWLGDRWQYVEQGAGDLGDRLKRAFQNTTSVGLGTIAIGIDCPGITAQTLWDAFVTLGDHDLVVGPATDGGYYLIGMKHSIPALFSGIDWSTDRVLTQTLAIAHRLNLTVACLEPLSDIDYPEDLEVWYRVQAAAPTISPHHDSVSFCDSSDAQ